MSDAAVSSIRARLRQFAGQYPVICERFDLQYSWLSKFASGERGKRPSFDLISKLDKALTTLEAEQEDQQQPPTPDHTAQ